MNKSNTKPPPPGYLDFIDAMQEAVLTIEEAMRSVRKWAIYGPKAMPFIKREMRRAKEMASAAMNVAHTQGAAHAE